MAPPPTEHASNHEARIARLESGLEGLTTNVSELVHAVKARHEDDAKWRIGIEKALVSQGKPTWGVFAAVIPIVAITATWVASYVSGVSDRHSAEEQRLNEIMRTQIASSAEAREQIRQRIDRLDADNQAELARRSQWMLETSYANGRRDADINSLMSKTDDR